MNTSKIVPIVAALAVGGAGITQLIDQTTMIVLIAALMVIMPGARGACWPARGN